MFDGFSFNQIEDYFIKHNIQFSYGESIHSHTAKKIQLISSYIDNWLYVASNSKVDDIYFIDLMSNAGLYKSGELSTYVMALNSFVKHATKHEDKRFHLICNDYDSLKFQTISNVKKLYEEEFAKQGITNIIIEANNDDALILLNKLTSRFKKFSNKLVLLFVDPYCMINADLAISILKFAKSVYSEIIINYFYNDYIRNYKNENAKEKMESIHDFSLKVCNMNPLKSKPIDVRNKFIQLILSTKMNYNYIFTMKNSCNGILYYLLYFTPNLKGLRKIKNATWKSFGCNNEYSPINIERDYLNIFGETEEEEKERYVLEDYKEHLKSLKGTVISYSSIEEYILQNTPLSEGKILDIIIRPLIKENLLLKQNVNGKNKYKDDDYLVI